MNKVQKKRRVKTGMNFKSFKSEQNSLNGNVGQKDKSEVFTILNYVGEWVKYLSRVVIKLNKKTIFMTVLSILFGIYENFDLSILIRGN